MEIERRKVIQQAPNKSMEQIMNEMLSLYYNGLTTHKEENSLDITGGNIQQPENETEIVPEITKNGTTNSGGSNSGNRDRSSNSSSNNKDKYGIYITEKLRKKVEEAAKNLKEYFIGNKIIYVHPDVGDRIVKANEEMKRETGKEIKISHHYRTLEQQLEIWLKSWEGEPHKSRRKYRAARPGVSNHNYGLAIDVVNWREAEPYLRKYGLVNDIPDDRLHFSINGR